MVKTEHKAHVSQKKKDKVAEIVKLLKEYPIVGVLNMEGLPAAQAQKIRGKLRNDVAIAMTRKTLLARAIEKVKSEKVGVEKLLDHFGTVPALMFTKENPFKLYKMIKKSKSPASAKAGQKAPYDIIIKAGPTPFTPGPIISELAGMGLKSKVDQGKINILADAVVCKEGGVINDKVSSLLLRLGITPMEVGLDLVAVFEKGEILTRKVLDIDEKVYIQNITDAARSAFNLAVEAAYMTNDTREVLIQKAFRDAKAIAFSQNILADAVVGDILAKAERENHQIAAEAHYV